MITTTNYTGALLDTFFDVLSLQPDATKKEIYTKIKNVIDAEDDIFEQLINIMVEFSGFPNYETLDAAFRLTDEVFDLNFKDDLIVIPNVKDAKEFGEYLYKKSGRKKIPSDFYDMVDFSKLGRNGLEYIGIDDFICRFINGGGLLVFRSEYNEEEIIEEAFYWLEK